MRIRIGLIVLLAIIGVVIATYAMNSSGVHKTDNHYSGIYKNSVVNMQRADQSLNELRVDQDVREIPALATSKTCSTRCSTTCSNSCTTTRGCSSNCKSLTDGCPGSTSSDSSLLPSVVPSRKLDELLNQEQEPSIPVNDFSTATSYKVTKVVGGDTIVIDSDGEENTVHLIGVKTPKPFQPLKPVEFYGKEALGFITNLLKGEKVYIEYELGMTEEKNNQILAYVYRAPDGLFVNLEIIRQGYGRAYTDSPFQYTDLFRFYEKRARESQKGLWAEDAKIPKLDISPR